MRCAYIHSYNASTLSLLPCVSPPSQVPSEVQVVAERYCRKRSRRNQLKKSRSSSSIGEDGEDRVEDGNDLPIDLYSTSCKRECVDNFHETGKDRAMDEVAKLYELVKNMPDGPQKTHFMKRASVLGLYVATSIPIIL